MKDLKYSNGIMKNNKMAGKRRSW